MEMAAIYAAADILNAFSSIRFAIFWWPDMERAGFELDFIDTDHSKISLGTASDQVRDFIYRMCNNLHTKDCLRMPEKLIMNNE